ncbi:unnamed protein product, partial [Nesidiocoris tenuis]
MKFFCPSTACRLQKRNAPANLLRRLVTGVHYFSVYPKNSANSCARVHFSIAKTNLMIYSPETR